MNNGFISFGNIPNENKSEIINIIYNIYAIFNVEPNVFIISGGNHASKPTSKSVFEDSLIKYGCKDIYMVDSFVKMKNGIDYYFSIFFCEEKSHIRFSCNKNVDLEIAKEFWEVSSKYMRLIYGFSMHNIQYSPILYSTGTHIYKLGFIENLIKKEQIQKEKYWIHNYSESKNGLIRDIYKINLFNEKQLSCPIVGNITLGEYIHTHDIGNLSKFGNNMQIWHISDADMAKADEVKDICNENTILNSSKWKFK
jgi:hypothetical protein